MKRINHISLYIIFLSCLKGKRKKKFNKKRWKYDTINYSVCRIFLCPIVNRRERPLEIQGRRVESIKRGVHILTRKKDIRRLCVHRACIRRKEREREERRGSLGRNKTKEARMRKAFFGDICRVLARELCVGCPLFLVRLVLADRIFQRLPTARTCPVPIQDWFIDRHSMLDFWATPKEKWTTERKRERERRNSCLVGLRPFPLINLFSRANQRFHPVVVRILDFFFFNQRFFLNYRQFVVSIGKEDFDINRDEAIDIYFYRRCKY